MKASSGLSSLAACLKNQSACHNELFVKNDLARVVTLKAVCAANDIDDPQPTVYIMLPW